MVKAAICFLAASVFMLQAQDIPTLVKRGEILQEYTQDFAFTEGPARDKEGNIFFTDQPNNRILKWNALTGQITTFLQPSGRANGLYFDRDGNLLACADEKFQLWKIDPRKKVSVVLKKFEKQDFNGPNDLWIHPNGNIYFTDPYYQRPYWKREKGEIQGQHLYVLRKGQKTAVRVHDGFVQPNGIIGSSDGKKLYVADIGEGKTYSFKIENDGTLTNKQLFVEMGSDGMTMDEIGNVYLTNQKGVTVFDDTGQQVLNIPIDKKWTANVTFGGANLDVLFITAMDAVYTLKMNVKGVNQVIDL